MPEKQAHSGELDLRRHRRRKAHSNATPRLWVGLREWARDARLLGAVLVLGSALCLGFLFFAPVFEIDHVVVQGNQVLPEGEAVQYSEAQGTNLFLLDVTAVEERLLAIPYVERVRVERTLPNQLRLRIWEAFPSVSWSSPHSTQRYLVDDDGLVLGLEQPGMSELIYIVNVEEIPVELMSTVDAEAVRTAQQVFSRLNTDLGISLLPFEFQAGRGITAVSASGWRACFGDSQDLEQKVHNLLALLQSGVEFSFVDLRLPNQIRYY